MRYRVSRGKHILSREENALVVVCGTARHYGSMTSPGSFFQYLRRFWPSRRPTLTSEQVRRLLDTLTEKGYVEYKGRSGVRNIPLYFPTALGLDRFDNWMKLGLVKIDRESSLG